MSFVKNAWYMAGWADEISEALLRRLLFGVPVLLYRTASGVAALEDVCPHRFAPLSLGVREGDNVRCAYHGLKFNPEGQCVHNPFSDKIPQSARVRRFATHERDGVVWIYAGEADQADISAIPDFSMLKDGSNQPPIRGYKNMRAQYEYLTDNLMDLSHIEFVHKGSFAGQGVIFAGKHHTREEGDMLHSNWWMQDVAAPPHTQGIYPPDTRTDHWLDMRWQAPATMMLQVGATPKGEPRDAGIIVHQAHIVTPESENSSHYFWATTRSAPMTDFDEMLRALMAQAFDEEDAPIIEAAYANLDGRDFWERRPASLGIDAAGARARRRIQSLLEQERANAR